MVSGGFDFGLFWVEAFQVFTTPGFANCFTCRLLDDDPAIAVMWQLWNLDAHLVLPVVRFVCVPVESNNSYA